MLPEIPKFDNPTCPLVSIQMNMIEQLVNTGVSCIDLEEVAHEMVLMSESHRGLNLHDVICV